MSVHAQDTWSAGRLTVDYGALPLLRAMLARGRHNVN
jgi:hypothetical protein